MHEQDQTAYTDQQGKAQDDTMRLNRLLPLIRLRMP